jgi:hypothetical protein
MMNRETGFCIASALVVPVCRTVEDPRGARHWGASFVLVDPDHDAVMRIGVGLQHTGHEPESSVSTALTTQRRIKVDSIMGYFWTPAKPEVTTFGELGQIIGSSARMAGSKPSSSARSPEAKAKAAIRAS